MRTDILERGLERDIPLKFASQMSALPSGLIVPSFVDESALALRAARATSNGALLVAPSSDWEDAVTRKINIFSDTPPTVATNLAVVNTKGWGYALLQSSYHGQVGATSTAWFEIWSYTAINNRMLIFAAPIISNGQQNLFVIPLLADQHIVRYRPAPNAVGGTLNITLARLAPGIHPTSPPPHCVIIDDATLTAGVDPLFVYANPLWPRLAIHIIVPVIGGTNTYARIWGDYYDSANFGSWWTPTIVSDANHDQAFIVNTGTGMEFHLEIGGTNPSVELTVSMWGG